MRCNLPGLRQIDVYETRQAIFVTGYDVLQGGFRALEIPRPAPGGGTSAAGTSPRLHLVHGPSVYTRQQLDEYLKSRQVSLGTTRAVSGGYCLYGFVRLLESVYLIVVTSAKVAASLHGHDIFTVKDTACISLTYKPRKTIEETRYRAMLSAMDFSNGFYFSYTYDLTSSLQANHALNFEEGTGSGSSSSSEAPPLVFSPQDMFVWNLHPLGPLLQLEHAPPNAWVVPIIYGFLEQKTVRLEDGHLLRYTLLARRSRRFAGTRYLRRGVDNQGFTANEVETEQIVTIESGIYKLARSSSLVQLRGSIPLYWCHTSLLTPSPDIRIEHSDPQYVAARMHFDRLVGRYGPQIAVLNLVRQRHGGREVLLGKSFGLACARLAAHAPPSDFPEEAKKPSLSTIPLYAITQLVTVFGIISVAGTTEGAERSDSLAEGEGEGEGGGEGGNKREEDEDSDDGPDVDLDAAPAAAGVDSVPITYLAFDLLDAHDQHAGPTVFDTLTEISKAIYPRTGFFVMPPHGKAHFKSFPVDAAAVEADSTLSVLLHSTPAGAAASTWSPSDLGAGGSSMSSSSGEGSMGPVLDDGRLATFESSGPAAELGERDVNEFKLVPLTVPTTSLPASPRGEEPASVEAAAPRGSTTTATSPSSSSSSSSSSKRSHSPSPGSDEGEGDAGGEGEEEKEEGGGFRDDWGGEATAGPGVLCGLLQRGVLRTNCIDCLDRTNIGQFTYAKFVLPMQLRALGVHLTSAGMSDVLLLLMEAWARHGDEIAKQYGGSGAMHRVDVKGTDAFGATEFAMTGGLTNGVVAINRYYSNVSIDAEKQQGIDLLLGVFEPRRGAAASWDLDLGPTSMRGKLPPTPPPPPPQPLVDDAAGETRQGGVGAGGAGAGAGHGVIRLACLEQTCYFHEQHEQHHEQHSLTSSHALQSEQDAPCLEKAPLDARPSLRGPSVPAAWNPFALHPNTTPGADPVVSEVSTLQLKEMKEMEDVSGQDPLRYSAQDNRRAHGSLTGAGQAGQLPGEHMKRRAQHGPLGAGAGAGAGDVAPAATRDAVDDEEAEGARGVLAPIHFVADSAMSPFSFLTDLWRSATAQPSAQPSAQHSGEGDGTAPSDPAEEN